MSVEVEKIQQVTRPLHALIPGWVELQAMGFQTFYGFLNAADIAGVPMLRLDTPRSKDPEDGMETRLFAPGAIYCIVPVSHEHVIDALWPTDVEPF